MNIKEPNTIIVGYIMVFYVVWYNHSAKSQDKHYILLRGLNLELIIYFKKCI